MENNIHKGTELSNVNETWDQNERKREEGSNAGADDATDIASGGNDLQQLIKEEATEYDNANKEERILGGERASVNDDQQESASDEG